MTRVYIVRHCEAEGNNRRLFQGLTDCDITEMGQKQLDLLSERFSEIHLDKVYTSPLIRARKTAEAVRGNRDIPLISNKDLIEIDGGIIEGKVFATAFVGRPDLAKAWNNSPQDFAPDGGEPMRHAYERIWRAVLGAALESRGQTVALATHGGVIRCLNCRMNYGTIDRLKDTPWCENTGITLIEFDDGMNPKTVFMNDTSHLPKELLPVRSRLAEVMDIDSNVG